MKTKIILSRQKSAGAALLMVLVIVSLVSLLALFSVRGTLLQEKMAQAILTQNHTLQAAESGLVQAEHWLANTPQPVFKVISQRYSAQNMIEECEKGICAMSVPPTGSVSTAHFWAKADFWENCVSKEQCIEGDEVGQWKIKPRYVIEDYGYSNNSPGRDMMARNPLQEPGTKLMRITAWAELAGSHSIAQSVIQR